MGGAPHQSCQCSPCTAQFNPCPCMKANVLPGVPGVESGIHLEHCKLLSHSRPRPVTCHEHHLGAVGRKLDIGVTNSDRFERNVLPGCLNLHPAAWLLAGLIQGKCLCWLQFPTPADQPTLQWLPSTRILQHHCGGSEISPCHLSSTNSNGNDSNRQLTSMIDAGLQLLQMWLLQRCL